MRCRHCSPIESGTVTVSSPQPACDIVSLACLPTTGRCLGQTRMDVSTRLRAVASPPRSSAVSGSQRSSQFCCLVRDPPQHCNRGPSVSSCRCQIPGTSHSTEFFNIPVKLGRISRSLRERVKHSLECFTRSDQEPTLEWRFASRNKHEGARSCK
jgi:hypothetical protein